MKLILTLITFGFSCLLIILILFGPQPKSYTIKVLTVSEGQLHLFRFKGGKINLEANAENIVKKYNATRSVAIDKMASFVRQRNLLLQIFHGLCILSIIGSFVLSYMGATRGLIISSENVVEKIDDLKKSDSLFKKRIIVISAISILLTTLSNRTSVYADQLDNKATEIGNLIKDIDGKIISKIEVEYAFAMVNAFELDISKY